MYVSCHAFESQVRAYLDDHKTDPRVIVESVSPDGPGPMILFTILEARQPYVALGAALEQAAREGRDVR